jgi:hypothetical protein
MDTVMSSPPPSTIPDSPLASFEPAVPQSMPPPTPSPHDLSADIAGTLNQALVANHAATAAMEYPLGSASLEDMQWTLPGTDTLTPQALALTDTYIDQSKFPEGVSPLTMLYRESSPVPLDRAWTEQELARISNLNPNPTVTPPPTYHQLPLPDAEEETIELPTLDSLMGQVALQEDKDIFMEPPPQSPPPVVNHSPPRSPARSIDRIPHDEDQVMADETADGQDGSGLPHGEEEQPMDPPGEGDGHQKLSMEKGHAETAPTGTQPTTGASLRASRKIIKKIVMSSDEEEGESEVSDTPAQPIRKKKDLPKSSSRIRTVQILLRLSGVLLDPTLDPNPHSMGPSTVTSGGQLTWSQNQLLQ